MEQGDHKTVFIGNATAPLITDVESYILDLISQTASYLPLQSIAQTKASLYSDGTKCSSNCLLRYTGK